MEPVLASFLRIRQAHTRDIADLVAGAHAALQGSAATLSLVLQAAYDPSRLPQHVQDVVCATQLKQPALLAYLRASAEVAFLLDQAGGEQCQGGVGTDIIRMGIER